MTTLMKHCFSGKVEFQNYDQNPKEHLENSGTSENTQEKTITEEQVYQEICY